MLLLRNFPHAICSHFSILYLVNSSLCNSGATTVENASSTCVNDCHTAVDALAASLVLSKWQSWSSARQALRAAFTSVCALPTRKLFALWRRRAHKLAQDRLQGKRLLTWREARMKASAFRDMLLLYNSALFHRNRLCAPLWSAWRAYVSSRLRKQSASLVARASHLRHVAASVLAAWCEFRAVARAYRERLILQAERRLSLERQLERDRLCILAATLTHWRASHARTAYARRIHQRFVSSTYYIPVFIEWKQWAWLRRVVRARAASTQARKLISLVQRVLHAWAHWTMIRVQHHKILRSVLRTRAQSCVASCLLRWRVVTRHRLGGRQLAVVGCARALRLSFHHWARLMRQEIGFEQLCAHRRARLLAHHVAAWASAAQRLQHARVNAVTADRFRRESAVTSALSWWRVWLADRARMAQHVDVATRHFRVKLLNRCLRVWAWFVHRRTCVRLAEQKYRYTVSERVLATWRHAWQVRIADKHCQTRRYGYKHVLLCRPARRLAFSFSHFMFVIWCSSYALGTCY